MCGEKFARIFTLQCARSIVGTGVLETKQRVPRSIQSELSVCVCVCNSGNKVMMIFRLKLFLNHIFFKHIPIKKKKNSKYIVANIAIITFDED